jgi:hypothetical protein
MLLVVSVSWFFAPDAAAEFDHIRNCNNNYPPDND